MKKYTLVLLFLILSFFVSVNSSFAQCPSDVPSNPAFPWQGSNCYNTTVLGCSVKVCYCFRTYPDPANPSVTLNEYVVTSITMLSSCSNTWFDIIKYASKQILLDNPQSFPCPRCPLAFDVRWEADMITCWHITPSIVALCEDHGWCIQSFYICCDQYGHPAIYGQGNETEIEPPCEQGEYLPFPVPVPPEGADIPTAGPCYYITNCDSY